ncbi:MAG: hypothetical protein EPO32_14480 [Anaerolineae bacterium]|nr:MAG: hypothetical protein EPO32_14480 [Anaerolineae bacterium]
MKSPVSISVALAGGWLILLAYIFDLDALRTQVLGWVVLVAAAGLLLGVLNLAAVHFGKLRSGTRNALYSFLLIISMFITFVVVATLGPGHEASQWIFTNIQLPVEASLMAVMAVTLVFAAARLLSRRTDLFAILFVVFAVITLAGSGPLLGFNIPLVGDVLRPWVTQVLAGAGARGILIGVSLGTIATGLRVLLAADKPYGA